MGVCLVMFHLLLPSGIKGLKVSCRYLRNNHTKSEAPHQLLCLKKTVLKMFKKTPRTTSVTKPILSIFASLEIGKYIEYHISSNKRRASNQHRPLISAAPLGIHIEISASPLISAATLNAALIRIVAIFYWELNQNAYGTSMEILK